MQWHRIPDQGTLRRPRRSGLIYTTSCASFILAQPINGAGLQLAAELWLESFRPTCIAKEHLYCLEQSTGSRTPSWLAGSGELSGLAKRSQRTGGGVYVRARDLAGGIILCIQVLVRRILQDAHGRGPGAKR